MYDLLAPSNSPGQFSPVPSLVPGSRRACHKWGWKEWMGLSLEIEAQSYVHCALSVIKSHFESHFLPIHLPQPELPCSIIIQGCALRDPCLQDSKELQFSLSCALNSLVSSQHPLVLRNMILSESRAVLSSSYYYNNNNNPKQTLGSKITREAFLFN